MSGLFGVVDPRRGVDSAAICAALGLALRHYPWHATEPHAEPQLNLCLGRHHIGIFNTNPQPIWDAAGRRAVFLTGELYAIDDQEIPVERREDACLILELYERRGADFARSIDGAYLAAILDLDERRLLIANDRFGLYPLYYAHHHGRFVFAPEIKGVLSDPGMARTLDLTALAQFMRFQQLLGDRTFVQGLKVLPPAVTLTCDLDSANIQIDPYWSFAEIPEHPNVSLAEAAEEAGRLLRRSVHRLHNGPYQPGALLSGGLDSRVIVGLMPPGIPTATFGHPHSRDALFAARIAQVVRSHHQWYDLSNGQWVLEHVDDHFRLTEGLTSWIHMHGMNILAGTRDQMAVNLTGWGGGEVLGTYAERDLIQAENADDQAFICEQFAGYTQRYTWPGLTEAEERLLFTETLRPQLLGLAFESFREEVRPYLGMRPDMRGDFLFLHTQCRRMTSNMVTMYRSHFETRSPFFDLALASFALSLPLRIRGDRTLLRAIIDRETPALAMIPYDRDESLPTLRSWLHIIQLLAVKSRRRLNRLVPLFGQETMTLYADYEGYLRTDLRQWAESLLFDNRTTDRGIFETRFVRSLLDRHMSGRELWTIGKIAPMMTFEMMIRGLIEGSPNPSGLA